MFPCTILVFKAEGYSMFLTSVLPFWFLFNILICSVLFIYRGPYTFFFRKMKVSNMFPIANFSNNPIPTATYIFLLTQIFQNPLYTSVCPVPYL